MATSSVAKTTSSNRHRLLLLAAAGVLLLAAAATVTNLAPLVSARRRPVHLVVYVHEILDGPGQTEFLLINGTGPANPTLWSPHDHFGDTVVMDDLATEGPALDSAPVGRVFGTYTTASASLPIYTVSFTLMLSAGPYNGSTLVIAGIDEAPAKEHPEELYKKREHAVVGGTGALRGAQGYVVRRVMPVPSQQHVAVRLQVDASVPVPTRKAKAAASLLATQ